MRTSRPARPRQGSRPRRVIDKTLQRFRVRLSSGESALLALAFLYFFLVLASYYVLRPIRDEIGVAGGGRETAVAVPRHVSGDHRHLVRCSLLWSRACRGDASWPGRTGP